MRAFSYNAPPGRVLFGAGTLARLPEEADRLGLKRVLALTTPPREAQGQALAEHLGVRAAGVFAGAAMHTPTDATDRAMHVVARLRVDGLVAIGGGSTTGLAKALALRTDLPQIIIPTTYAGSEMTPILGETHDGAKVTQSSPRIRPEVVIYDINLTLGLPKASSVVSGVNAMAHAIEALYARDANPVTSLMAVEGLTVLARALPIIAETPRDVAARSDALYGAWLCGACLGAVGMSLHHKLCHVLGGAFDMPHAETHTVLLPHALAYNAPAAPEAMARMAAVFGTADPALALYRLSGRLGAPRSLKELGMPEAGVELAAERALANPYWNPRPLEREAIKALLARAWAGAPPLTEPGT